MKTLCRWWMLRQTAAGPLDAVRSAVLLTATWLLAWSAIDWWQRQPEPVFAAAGVPLLGWYAVGVLGLAALLWSRSSPRPAFGPLVVLSLGLVPVPLVLMVVLGPLLGPAMFWCAVALALLYALLYLIRGLASLTGRPQTMAALLGLAFIAGFVAASDLTTAIPDIWDPAEVPTASDDDIAERETALFEQADRIDRGLDAVQRDDSPLPQAFFLGFAGVGDEKVFAQEVALASRIIGERYATGARQLLLINDERNLRDAPLASVSGLDYALQGLASRMRLDRDVLFLAISSHGSSDPTIAVANSNFPLLDLTPDDLTEALDKAGIQWRVIFISACYAGGFIEPLRNARTLVITAAAADRTSFGCASDSDLTYFGEAFYRDALPSADSLRHAFDTAKTAIAAREQAEGETPSNPQAWFGTEIEAHLAKLTHGSLAGDAR
jgi:hypothetical protein